MLFSKSFGYALRGLLYVAIVTENNSKVQLDEIAKKLGIPRHFMGKVLKKLVKGGIINSTKGPHGGFYFHEQTLGTTLLHLTEITGENIIMNNDCVLRFRKCNSENPCPLHWQMDKLIKNWQSLLSSTTVGDLLQKEQPDFIKSIAVI